MISDTSGERTRLERSLPLLVAAAAALVYLNSLANGFALDDAFIVRNNERVHDLANLRAIWLTPYWPNVGALLGLYRPLAIFLYAVQWAISGGQAWVFHAGNIILHAGVTVLVYALARRFATPFAAALGALIFAVHPLHTEAVANIVGQAELIAAAAVLGAVLIHVDRPGLEVSWKRRLLIILLFLCALLAKESAITLPGLLVLADVAQRRVTLRRDSIRAYATALVLPLTLMAATIGAYLVLRISVLGSITGVDAAPAFPYLREQYRLLMAFRTWPEYLRLLVFPQDLAADYGPAIVLPVEGVTPMVALGFVILAATTALALLTPWAPKPGLAAGWFLISVLTVSNLFFPVGVLLAERTLYLPSVALALAIAFIWDAAQTRTSTSTSTSTSTRAYALTLLVILALMSLRTFHRNKDWKSTMTVLSSLVRDHPEAYRSQWVLAVDQWQKGNIARAEQHWLLAYRLWPRDSQFLADYANFFLSLRNYARAIQLLEQSRELHPMIERTRVMLAQAYIGAGRPADALRELDAARRLGRRTGIDALRGEALYQLARYDDASAAWRAAINEADKPFWLHSAELARSLAAAGRDSLAGVAFARARAVAPDQPLVQRTLAGLETALAQRCYRAQAACADPLAGWSVGLGAPPDSARSLQNARPR